MTQSLEPPWNMSMSEDKRAPSLEKLEQHTKKCWESILHFMVGVPDRKPSVKIVQLLVDMNLMQIEGEETLRITDKGFKFLLKDVCTQVWTFLLAYISTAEDRKIDVKEILCFLFQLRFLKLGKDYPIKALSEPQKEVLSDLKELGIIYQRKSKNTRRYYPTALALNLTTGSQGGSVQEENKGWIIVSTDYRVYAYTNSTLHISLLSLFLKLQYCLPNLVVGSITRESVREALINGISAQQILDFLEQNAHPETKRRSLESIKNGTYVPVLPETIADEIRLWESERNRVSYAQGVLYDYFPSQEVFEKVETYAKDVGVYIW
eukprot:CAMPEP_0174274416 /NCGR_PEP_ID=MMETSP0439-20130205/57916_1 /TAXON_ID=0 /ORGANISM="Stereomyxa ramosa, Strain Chinc5" /LENGTH=320 /DNA_ID=CAMNT_0015366167 /DNA_START=485 /DNA_END=1444 /DNA_ORIENTATION=+